MMYRRLLCPPSLLSSFRRTMSGQEVLGEVTGRVGVITLNRPKALNSLNLPMINTLRQIIGEWKSSDSVDSLIIQSSIPKAFCAGGDIVAVTSKTKDFPDPAVFFKLEYELDHALATMNAPVTSLINGIVMGGGVGLSLHGRYRVATEKTTFAMPEVSIGLFPDVGGSWFLPRLKGKLGWYLGMTGQRMKGSDVFHGGIATHMCPSESLPQLKEDLLAAAPGEIESVLTSYNAKFPLQPFSLSDETLGKIDSLFGEARSGEDLMSRLYESSSDPFSAQVLSSLSKASPTSVAVTFRLLQEGMAAKSLGECLNIEFNVVDEVMKRKDFYEGVRALLIDKDLTPKWSPPSIQEVGDISDFFKKDRQLDLF